MTRYNPEDMTVVGNADGVPDLICPLHGWIGPPVDPSNLGQLLATARHHLQAEHGDTSGTCPTCGNPLRTWEDHDPMQDHTGSEPHQPPHHVANDLRAAGINWGPRTTPESWHSSAGPDQSASAPRAHARSAAELQGFPELAVDIAGLPPAERKAALGRHELWARAIGLMAPAKPPFAAHVHADSPHRWGEDETLGKVCG